MPPRGLPGNANLEQLRNGARAFQRAVRAGDAGAIDVVREFHPRLHELAPGSPELAAFKLADAQLVVARQFNFASWPKLKAHLERVAAYARSPHELPVGATAADEFLRLACLNYGNDDLRRRERAGAMLDEQPELARASIHTAAAAGDLEAARSLLATDPSLGRRVGGPHGWEPLLYVAYTRLPGLAPGVSVALARLLLDHGANPNAGFLWEGLCPPFTALTGALGDGEGGQPVHRDELALARLLLERGADANDGQAIYNNGHNPDDGWIELLLEFGLGRGDGGEWKRRFADTLDSPREMVEDALMAAAYHGFAHRVRLLLDHGADPDGVGSRHPIYEGRMPIQAAAASGHLEVVELLRAAGARSPLDEIDVFLAAATAADRARVEAMRAADAGIVARARERAPHQLIRAAEMNNPRAVQLLIELGFDVNALERTAPLHEAAMRGNLEVIELLLEAGADPNLHDRGYDATPAGWAEHFEHKTVKRALDAAAGRVEETIETGLAYRPGEPVRVRVVRHGGRVDVADNGGAVELAGHPRGWRAAAERLAREHDVNLSRGGMLTLPVVRVGPPEERVVERIAEASLALYQDLLDLHN